MRRVSSRQRLVSWDAFDATDAMNSDHEESYVDGSEASSLANSDYDTAASAIESDAEDNDNTGGASPSQQPHNKRVIGRKRERKAKPTSSPQLTLNKISPPSSPVAVNDTTTLLGDPTVPVIVPSYSWEVLPPTITTSTLSPCIKNSASTNTLSSYSSAVSTLPSSPIMITQLPMNFDSLMKDVHYAIFSFLDLSSLRSIMAVNTHYRDIVVSEDAQNSVWMDHCHKSWISANVATTTISNHTTKWLDGFHLPTAVAKPSVTNLPLLLSMTAENPPTGVDVELVNAKNRRADRLRPFRHGHHMVMLRGQRPMLGGRQSQQQQQHQDVLQYYQDPKNQNRFLVKYTGPVGAGDRCIRSDYPLPRPKHLEETLASLALQKCNGLHIPFGLDALRQQRCFPPHPQQQQNRLFNFLYRTNGGRDGNTNTLSSSSSSSDKPTLWKPFVMPFAENSTTMNVTPRLIAYYEVSILHVNNDDDNIDRNDTDHDDVTTGNNNRNDCVAVGIATRSFHVHTRMPGWDPQSFGYHGDDGGIFHSSGGMVKPYGPKFGAGDTVGCGIDYVTQGIFYTLNGKFLGYGWKGIDDEFFKNDLFPVVGVDTNCPLYLNFGAKEPFQFDLSNFIMKHEDIIASQYRLDDVLTKDSTRHTSSSSTRSLCSISTLNSVSSSSSPKPRRRRFGKRSRDGGRGRRITA